LSTAKACRKRRAKSSHERLACFESKPGPKALQKIGWSIKRQKGSHRTLSRPAWEDYVFAFHDGEEIGPVMLSKIAKKTGLTSGDL
jgi:predicted RNA binding protein YcfA (HicA-like mRNA interferase family)